MNGLNEVLKNLNDWAQKQKAGCEAVAKTTAANMQNYARDKRRWKDITGAARAGLHGDGGWESETVLKAFIAHGMDYGVYLELAHDRKYKLLEEVRDRFRNDFVNNIKRIMNA
jgi:hypothetical protein